MFVFGFLGLKDHSLVALSRSPPCIEPWNTVKWSWRTLLYNLCIIDVSQYREFFGVFDGKRETPISKRIKIRSTAALYGAFAARTLTSSATLKPVKPSGMSLNTMVWVACPWEGLALDALWPVMPFRSLAKNAHAPTYAFLIVPVFPT